MQFFIQNEANTGAPACPRLGDIGARRLVIELVFEAEAGTGGLGRSGPQGRIAAGADHPHRLEAFGDIDLTSSSGRSTGRLSRLAVRTLLPRSSNCPVSA